MTLNTNALRQAESERTLYRAQVAAGTNPAALLDPKFWVHVARRLRVGDRVEIIDVAMTWFAEVLVLEVGKIATAGARVAYIVEPVDLSNRADLDKPAATSVVWNGPSSMWSVRRNSDGAVLREGFKTQDEAAAWVPTPDLIPSPEAA